MIKKIYYKINGVNIGEVKTFKDVVESIENSKFKLKRKVEIICVSALYRFNEGESIESIYEEVNNISSLGLKEKIVRILDKELKGFEEYSLMIECDKSRDILLAEI